MDAEEGRGVTQLDTMRRRTYGQPPDAPPDPCADELPPLARPEPAVTLRPEWRRESGGAADEVAGERRSRYRDETEMHPGG